MNFNFHYTRQAACPTSISLSRQSEIVLFSLVEAETLCFGYAMQFCSGNHTLISALISRPHRRLYFPLRGSAGSSGEKPAESATAHLFRVRPLMESHGESLSPNHSQRYTSPQEFRDSITFLSPPNPQNREGSASEKYSLF